MASSDAFLYFWTRNQKVPFKKVNCHNSEQTVLVPTINQGLCCCHFFFSLPSNFQIYNRTDRITEAVSNFSLVIPDNSMSRKILNMFSLSRHWAEAKKKKKAQSKSQNWNCTAVHKTIMNMFNLYMFMTMKPKH